jgi:CheY-like chemotaxis protein
MGHELRTPMNSVLGFLTLIENGLFENEEELKEFSHSAKLSAESLLGLLNDVVEIAKIQEGSVEIVNSEFNIHEEINKINTSLAPHIKQNNIKFTCNIAEDVPENILLDQSKYTQIVINLLRNSIQTTENGEVNLTIDKKVRSGGQEQLVTKISDNGKAIPQALLDKLVNGDFESKEKGSKITSGVLHIMICKELLNLLNGTLTAESNKENGSKFCFTVDIESKITTTDENAGEGANESVEFSGRPKLLLVEDNPISRKVEQKLLHEAGYRVDCVENGKEAIEHVKKGIYNLVLMDIELKDMDGLEATKIIRELADDIGQIPIIAVTAHSSMKDREKCLLAGMNDYISKPINITFLKMTIDQWLQHAKSN